jgi:gamma-glutamylcyclotransferase (GGCT)/AIG2-like uncharacterized protein YtfP
MRAKSKTAPDREVARRKVRPPNRSSAPQYLFVYGTLKRGGKAHSQLRKENGVRFSSSARIRADLYRLHGKEYPGAVLTSVPNRFIKGDLFILHNPAKTLHDLDEFEGVDEELFRRELVDVWARGRRFKAWAYVYARPVSESNLIPTGIYSSH